MCMYGVNATSELDHEGPGVGVGSQAIKGSDGAKGPQIFV